METIDPPQVTTRNDHAGTTLGRAVGLGSLAAGGYYFNFFLSLGDGGGIYLSAGYRRVDLLIATAVLWIVATALCWMALNLAHLQRVRPARRLMMAGIAAVMVAAFIRCYSKMSGVGVTDQVLTVTGGTPDGVMTKAVLLAPLLAAFVSFWMFPRAAGPALRFLSIAGLLALPVGTLRMLQTPIGRVDTPAGISLAATPVQQVAKAVPAPSRRVVWLMFDEFDPQVAFEGALGITPPLPQFTALMSQAVVFSRAASPGKSTDVSVPALLLGRPTVGNRYSGPGEGVLLSGDGARIPLNGQASLFWRVASEAGPVSILGFYHPYCEVFPAARCNAFGTAMGTRWFDGLANLLPKKITGLQDPMSEITRAQSDLLPAAVSDRHSSLVYLHMNVPHLPARYAAGHFGLKSGSPVEDYKVNLRLADEMLATVLREMAQPPAAGASQPEQMLIVSSDHWYRGRPGGAHPALQVVKIVGDNEARRIEQPVSAYHLAQLVQDFLAGQVSTQHQVAQWYAGKPFVPTWIPDEH